MELLQLRYFQKVAETENMTKAAEALHIAQPSLSKTIARLEESVGVRLFERTGKRIRLNEFGECFLRRVNRILNELEDSVSEVRDMADRKSGSVCIGSATARLLPDLIKTYLLQNSDVRLRLLQFTQHTELLWQLEQGEIDISISSLPLQKKGICCRPLTEERIYLIVPANHRFAGRKKIRLQELQDEPLIYYTAECGVREIISGYCEQANFKPLISCECTTPEITCRLVEAGLGLAFLPEYMSAMEYTKNLSWIPLTEPDMKRTIWMSWNQERYLSRAARDFRDFVSGYFV